jgi:uncharacterized membrane protein YfcA
VLIIIGPWEVLEIFLVSIVAGIIGALFGLGGGVLIIPFLTLVENVPVPYAIGASIVSVVATSSASAATYVHDHLTNLRLGMFLELGTVAGAITGAYVAAFIPAQVLFLLFGLLLLYATAVIIHGRRVDYPRGVMPDRIAQRLRLSGEYLDIATHEKFPYEVTKSSQTLTISYFAGIVSGLLGVGGGLIKVPTSNFMIGVTAAASASIYFTRGQVDPLIVAPLMIGVVLGATIGTRLLRKTPPLKVKVMFGILLAIVAVLMILRAANVPIVV